MRAVKNTDFITAVKKRLVLKPKDSTAAVSLHKVYCVPQHKLFAFLGRQRKAWQVLQIHPVLAKTYAYDFFHEEFTLTWKVSFPIAQPNNCLAICWMDDHYCKT